VFGRRGMQGIIWWLPSPVIWSLWAIVSVCGICWFLHIALHMPLSVGSLLIPVQHVKWSVPGHMSKPSKSTQKDEKHFG
jgi:hypothetical protein